MQVDALTSTSAEPVRQPRSLPASFKGGQYTVRSLLGVGARKEVYLVHDSLLARDVALALIRTEGLGELGRSRIRHEAQIIARLGEHPDIVQIYEFGEDQDTPYMVLPVMRGGTLKGMVESSGKAGALWTGFLPSRPIYARG